MPRRTDDGYALVAAVTAVAAFACIALQVLAADRGALAIETGLERHAKLAAAAEAGLGLAMHGLGAEDRAARWSIDGRPRRLDFDGVQLTLTVEDERGKAPLAALSDNQARALFAGAGASGERLDALVREFRAWQTDQNAAFETGDAAPRANFPMRHGDFRTVGELMGLPDMDRTLYARLAPAVTTFFEETGAFDPTYAQGLAKAAMKADELPDPDQADEAPAVEDQRPNEELADDDYVGRTLTIRAVARDSGGAETHRTEIIELTGDKARPYWIRYAE